MALLSDRTTITGINLTNAYSKVENINLTTTSIAFNVRYYKEKNLPFFDEVTIKCIYNINGENPFIQAYEYLKTLEEFKDAEDV